MKRSVVDAQIVIEDRIMEKMGEEEFLVTIDPETNRELSLVHKPNISPNLYQQDQPFMIFDPEILNSGRVGPTRVAPTRYWGDLHFKYLTKNPNSFSDGILMERVAKWFQEQIINGVRFRTYTPYPTRKDNGFTAYSGVISYDFELYRGA